MRASRRSLELKSWSIRSSSIRLFQGLGGWLRACLGAGIGRAPATVGWPLQAGAPAVPAEQRGQKRCDGTVHGKNTKRSGSAAASGANELGTFIPLLGHRKVELTTKKLYRVGSDFGSIFLNQRFDQQAQPQDRSASSVREFDLPSGIATQVPADIAVQVSKDPQYPLARGFAILKDCCYRSVRKFAFGYMKREARHRGSHKIRKRETGRMVESN
jgi:hypothetical protein